MTKAIIPYQPPDIDLPSTNVDFHKDNFYKKRNEVLKELRCITGLPEMASKLDPDTVYKLVAQPEGAKLFKDGAGNLKGVFYKDGKILEHAKFKAVRPSLIKAASAVGSQILLISIAMQLNRVEKGISKILDEFHDDRIAEISSGVSQYNQAMLVQDIDRQSRIIENAIQTLNTGIEKIIRSLKKQIKDAPDTTISFFDNWGSSKSDQAKEKFETIEESFQACLLGIKTLSECYSTLDEPRAAISTISTSLKNLKEAGIESAAKKSRLVPYDGGRLPEEPWQNYLEHEHDFINQIKECGFFANNEFDSIEIELKPIELLENNNA